MSVVRFTDGPTEAHPKGSDVYIYEGSGGMVCAGCIFENDTHPRFDPESGGMMRHVIDHIEAGHYVPKHVLGELHEDLVSQRQFQGRPKGE